MKQASDIELCDGEFFLEEPQTVPKLGEKVTAYRFDLLGRIVVSRVLRWLRPVRALDAGQMVTSGDLA